ncbi:hypothetical protein RS694_12510 [Rhodoferax saidenbachensis]|uniref:Cell division protein FtsI n=2 Tax=Rhodoferax saidenbachensis TaxID=1484693 RepID=A0A1P8KFT5_9BURK|nr:hypothetical protein RS694_12510 [Rhodoferax saidenbachensis]
MASLLPPVALSLAVLTLSACSIVSPVPLWELAKATGGMATMSMQSEPGEAVNTVYYPHAPFTTLCIEFNPNTASADVIPALQTALRAHQIESRVYDEQSPVAACAVWLRYSAQMTWDKRPMTDSYQAYVSAASLTLQSAKGQVLSSSHYVVDPDFGRSKWATTHDKLAPVVAALVTGIVPERRGAPLSKEKS